MHASTCMRSSVRAATIAWMRSENSPASERAALRAASVLDASMRSATLSACARSTRPLRNARRVNSPGSAMRAPSSTQRRTTCAQHDGTAVSLELEDVFARIGVRRGKEDRDSAIDQRAVAIAEIGECRVTGRGHRAGNAPRYGPHVPARDPDHSDPAAARRGGDGGDCLAGGGQRRAFAAASAFSVLLMCHCCRIDSMFWQTQ